MPSRKKIATKKPAKKAKGRKLTKRRVVIAQSIGVISSIKCEASFKKAFENALNNNLTGGATITPTYKCTLGYDEAPLGNAVKQFVRAGVGLIVTFGGVVAFNAANKVAYNSATPFLSLVGGTPDQNGAQFPNPGTGQFYGGVSLESYAGNADRIAHLYDKGYQPADICLLYNPNSVMAGAEIAAWTGGTTTPAAGDGAGNNDSSNYPAVFAAIREPAIVVSADPYFHHSRDDLIAAANGSGKYVCYPLYNYRNKRGTNQPNHGHATLYGPKLEEAMSALGEMAAAVLNTGNPATDEPFIRMSAPVDL